MAPFSSRPAGSVSLSDLLDNAVRQLTPIDNGAGNDGFLYSGNRHESVPRALFLDRRLTPLERNAWQVFRLLLNADGVTAFPTYDQLRPYLASTPCAEQASHETIARALTLLRLTRWLSLVRRRRDSNSGRIRGNLYVLHDEPLMPFEAMQLDPEYLGLVSQSLSHASKAVQRVGLCALEEIIEDPMVSARALPTRLQVLAQHMAQGGLNVHDSYPQDRSDHESEEGPETLLRHGGALSSDSEAGAKASKTVPLRNPKQDRTVVSKRIHDSVTTVPRARELDGLNLPERFLALRHEQQAGALVALQQVSEFERQAVLDEWEMRCRIGPVRNPAGYLFGIIQKAIRGEFKVWLGDFKAHVDDAPLRPTSSNIANPDAVQTPLSQLHALLKTR